MLTHPMSDYVEYLYSVGLSPKTIRIYTRAVERLIAAGVDPDRCTARQVAEYAATLPKSTSTRRQLRSALTHYWESTGRRNGPRLAVRVPPKPRSRCRALSPLAAAAIANTAEGWHPEGLAALLALYLGLRREEIARARWDRFDRSFEWYRVLGKFDVDATLPVHPLLRRELHPTGYVWLFPGSRRRAHVTPTTVGVWIGRVAEAAGLPHVTPHELRHTAIATVNDTSGDLRAAQTFARHADPSTTAVYTRTTSDRLVDVVNALDYGQRVGLHLVEGAE